MAVVAPGDSSSQTIIMPTTRWVIHWPIAMSGSSPKRDLIRKAIEFAPADPFIDSLGWAEFRPATRC
jgi:hypothetical protein